MEENKNPIRLNKFHALDEIKYAIKDLPDDLIVQLYKQYVDNKLITEGRKIELV